MQNKLVKIYIDLDKELLQKSEEMAMIRNISLNEFIVESLRLYLDKQTYRKRITIGGNDLGGIIGTLTREEMYEERF